MGIESNWCSCTKCHAGYGWEDDSFDFTDKSGIDCLVCHDTTGTYAKNKGSCGYPDDSVDLAEAAKSVGRPDRGNCGSCHWYGGGGNNVKHGDMGKALADPSRELDVHMGGLGFQCQDCHTTRDHKITGKSNTSSVTEGTVSCTDCHEKRPHDASPPVLDELNDHCDALSCQACHIPEYARAAKTTTLWDWSRSGDANKVLEQSDDMEKVLSRKKGLMVRKSNLTPHYEWYNGKHERYLKGDPVNPDGVTQLNPPRGDITDPEAKITPYNMMHGVEPADAELHHLIVPKLFGQGGYFDTYDWQQSAEKGMAAAGLDFSGEITFVETVMHWRLNHQVPPAKQALSCLDCHGSEGVIDFRALGYDGDPAAVGGRRADSE